MKLPLQREQILPRLEEKLPSLLQGTPVALAYLYGSVALDQATSRSDVDIALILENNDLSPRQALHLELQLSVKLMEEADIPEPDVRIINDAPLRIRGQVACQGILLYSRDEEFRIRFETRTRDEYFDYQPIAQRLRAAYFADIRERGFLAER